MPTWNITRVVPKGRWIFRVQDEVYWEADFPGVGRWTNRRWWKAQPNFIHYEFYIPVDQDNHRYVGVMVNFTEGWETLRFYANYSGAIRWLFHGQFSGQDAWMVDITDAPPEKLYRPDISPTAWRNLGEEEYGKKLAATGTDGKEA